MLKKNYFKQQSALEKFGKICRHRRDLYNPYCIWSVCYNNFTKPIEGGEGVRGNSTIIIVSFSSLMLQTRFWAGPKKVTSAAQFSSSSFTFGLKITLTFQRVHSVNTVLQI